MTSAGQGKTLESARPQYAAGLTARTEQKRLNDAREKGIHWKKWGPYLSERQWRTVRENYSADGNAGDYFTHDQSRSRAYLYQVARDLGRADIKFLEHSFQGLLVNFNWWVNRKDPAGRNVFAGGFLGLDNIGVFDRSAPLPTGGSLEQADGTAWIAFYCQNMLEIALTLAEHDPVYEEHAYRFLQHFIWISFAMDRPGEHHDEMWDEEDRLLRRSDRLFARKEHP